MYKSTMVSEVECTVCIEETKQSVFKAKEIKENDKQKDDSAQLDKRMTRYIERLQITQHLDCDLAGIPVLVLLLAWYYYSLKH